MTTEEYFNKYKQMPQLRPAEDVSMPQADATRGFAVSMTTASKPTPNWAQKQISGIVKDMPDDFMQMGSNIRGGFNRRTQALGEDINRRQEDGASLRNTLGTSAGMVSATLRTAFDTLGEGGMFVAKQFLTADQEEKIAQKFQSGLAATLEATEDTAPREKVEQMIATYNVWAEENPEDAANVRDVSGIMLSLAEAAGLKIGSTAARHAADAAADVIGTAARTAGDVTMQASRQIDDGLRVAARSAGEAVDTAMEGRRAAVVASQQNKVDEAVGRITQAGADERAKEQAKRALLELDTSNVKTYEDLNLAINDQITTLSRRVDQELDMFPEVKTLDQLAKTTRVGDEVVSESPVRAALDGLEDAYTKTGEAANAARIRQLRTKAEADGLTLREVNELAREYGIEFRSRAFTKTGDIKTGFNAEAYENTRKSLKEVLRDQMPNDVTKSIDRRISDLYTTRDLTGKVEDRVAKLQQRIKNRTLAQKVGGSAAALVDLATFGSLRGFVARLMPSNMGNKAMNALEIQEELTKNLHELDRLLKIKGNKKFADAFEDWADNLQPGMSMRSTVRPDNVAKNIDAEDFRNITRILDNPDARTNYEDMLRGMGLQNADNAELVRFLREVVDEYDGVATREVLR